MLLFKKLKKDKIRQIYFLGIKIFSYKKKEKLKKHIYQSSEKK